MKKLYELSLLTLNPQVNEKFCKIIPGPNATSSSTAFQFFLTSPVIPSRDFLLDVHDGSIAEKKDARSLEKIEHLDEKSAISKECLCTRLEAKSTVSFEGICFRLENLALN